MEKYELLKDLPNAKAGEIFEYAAGKTQQLFSETSPATFSGQEIKEYDILNPDKGWFEKIEEQKYGGRVREEGDACWYIDEEGDIIEDCWMPTELQLIIYKAGNMFWTREEAEKEVARRKAYVVLKEDTKGFEPDWESLDTKWFVRYCRSLGGVLRPDWIQRDSAELIYFSSPEDAESSIKAHRQQWLDYLGIEEEE